MFECADLGEFPVGVNNFLLQEELHFGGCQALKMIPESFWNLTNVKIFRIIECEALEEFPIGINNLLSSEVLDF